MTLFANRRFSAGGLQITGRLGDAVLVAVALPTRGGARHGSAPRATPEPVLLSS